MDIIPYGVKPSTIASVNFQESREKVNSFVAHILAAKPKKASIDISPDRAIIEAN